MNPKFAAEFADPPSPYRGAPFWAWNGPLEPDALRRQIRVMHRMGLGGFFMHSRVGLDTAYLGREWMDCVAACIDEADKLDMRAWLYDEDRWPSGAAGGLVTKNPKYRQRHLVMETLRRPRDLRWSADTVAVFVARRTGDGLADVRRLPKGDKPQALAAREVILAFRVQVSECASWYNGYTYLDTMSHEAVKQFIATTHEAYRKEFGEALGRRVPGIFTDEPNYGQHGKGFWGGASHQVPWTDRLPHVFRKRYGYDVRDHLVELFHVVDGRQVSPARWHYHDCITHLFVDAFARQIGEWCEANGLEHTGHVLLEGNLDGQTKVVGSCMRFYEHMQAPGMDLLSEYAREYDTAKQVSSAARQFGRRWRLTETYGCTGWDFNFAAHKAIGDWQAALGINLRCQHLSWYTMLGEAKRDYPAAIFFQSPWWTHYRKVEDYFGRVNVAMSRGKEVRDVLVVHPVESMWAVYAEDAAGSRERLDSAFWRLRDTLLGANLDFDYGDEELMARHGSVRRTQGGPVLKIGKADYRVAVVPPMLTVRRSTLRLLARFRDAGGEVVFAGRPPACVEAEPCPDARRLAARCTKAPARGARLAEAVEPAGRRVSVADARGRQITPALYCLREDRDAWYLFVCNTGHDHVGRKSGDPMVRERTKSFDDVRITVASGTRAAPLELDCETGDMLTADTRRSGDAWQIRTSLPAIGSRLFVLPKKAVRRKAAPPRAARTVSTRRLNPKAWTVQLSESNVLVLDRPRYRIEGGRWREADDVLFVDQRVRKSLGIPQRGGSMAQPWTRTAPENPRAVAVELEYTFDVRSLPSGPLQVALERPDTFDVALNGSAVAAEPDNGWWVDPSLRLVALDPADLRLGTNTLRLVCRYDETHPGLEMAYLLGSFGASVRGLDVAMTASPPAALRLGDWTRQGLPFYSGNVCYTTTIRPRLRKGERLVVHVPDYRGVAVRVLVDGREAGVIAWPPNELDVTDLVTEAARSAGRKSAAPVALGLEVLGHRRNSHGPLHHRMKWPGYVGPGQFIARDDQVARYQLVPCGLMSPPKLIVRK